ncbi:unnamed protein product [Lactuca saligna]|uniref:Uncharacterized protein n=1 Tax=Lactuca saligna TaxID=75948 RepID=A0AA36E7J8_LACSI|nr:unnamed protein product [Lactuca saligna]
MASSSSHSPSALSFHLNHGITMFFLVLEQILARLLWIMFTQTFVQQGIYTYKDDKILLIDPSFKKAIKKSDIASSYSLKTMQILHVRKQKRKYGEAFVKHELENKNKVESCTRIKLLTGMNHRASKKLLTLFHRVCS